MKSSVETSKDSDDSIIRIKAGRVARLMDMVGELSLTADEVVHHPEISHLELDEFSSCAHKLNQLIRELQDLASSLRLVPIDSVFKRMQRLARDLARQTGKQFNFELKGEETEIDKVVVETLSDPLVHLIRNSIDHGLETPEERAATGKPAQGKVVLSARQDGGEIHIVVKDDGKGLNREKIIARAVEKGLIAKDANLTNEQIWHLIFEPGFSTKESVSSLSGRGVGMDVVKTTVNYLRGRIEIATEPGRGSTFTLIIPLNLAFLDTMVVRIKEKLFAVSIDNVMEVLCLQVNGLQSNGLCKSSAGDFECVRVRDELIPVCSLEEIYREEKFKCQDNQVLVVVKTFEGSLGIPVDVILGQFQATIKPLSGLLKHIRATSGYALLPNGDVALVLDCNQISQSKRRASQGVE